MAAKEKKSFVMYKSWGSAISNMTNEQAGSLIKAIYEYQDDRESRPDDPAIAFVFDIIKQKLDEDRQCYEETCEKRSKIASEREANKRAQETTKSTKDHKCAQETTKSTDTESDTDTESESDTDSENESDNEHPSDAKRKTRKHKHGEYGHVLLTDDQYDTLTKDHGTEATEAAIKKVDEYCEETGKTYKNYKLVLERWGFKSATARSGTTGGYVDAINHRFDPVAEWMEEHNDGS